MQNFKNHARLDPLYHFTLSPITLTLFIWSIVNVVIADMITSQSIFLVVLSFALIFTAFLVRWYGLKNQNRIIRLEMRQRYYEMTGKSFRDKELQLRLSQIIALRFASDEELLELMERTISEKLPAKEIKMAIKNWQADYNRV